MSGQVGGVEELRLTGVHLPQATRFAIVDKDALARNRDRLVQSYIVGGEADAASRLHRGQIDSRNHPRRDLTVGRSAQSEQRGSVGRGEESLRIRTIDVGRNRAR